MKLKTTFKQSTLLLLLMFFNLSISQTKNEIKIKEIDPRQFVTVLYQKTTTQGKFETIWNWENDKVIPFQKYNYLDVNGELKIDFEKLSLIKNNDFEGTISLEAEISGDNGTRKIEVNPYSEVGVERMPIGIKSEAPAEIAKKLLNMFVQLKEVDYGYISSLSTFDKDDITRREMIDNNSKLFFALVDAKNPDKEEILNTANRTAKLIDDAFFINNGSAPSLNFDIKNPNKTIPQIKNDINTLLNQYNDFYNNQKSTYNDAFKKSYIVVSSKVGLTLDYLNSFEAGGEDATKAFLSLINKDLVGYNTLKNTLSQTQKNLSNIKINENDLDDGSELLKNSELIKEAYKSLYEISTFEGSQFEQILKIFAVDKKREFNEKDFPNMSNDQAKRTFYYDLMEEYLQDISEKLSIAAGLIIYKKLVYATIDLSKSGAKPNEVLNLYVTWILDSKKDKVQNSPRLPIGKYYIRETGWKTEITDMFALIKRQHESEVDQSTVSPSNFKGSGGVVLMWTYNKEDIGIKIEHDKKDNVISITRKRKLVNFLEPSIGLNVSYLDFSTTKDVEIGTGLQLGLFKNKIFFGYGVNLHMISPTNQSPTYIYVGFSFAKLSDLFKNSGKISAN